MAGLAGNNEKEYYVPEQVSVSGGNLILRSDNIPYTTVSRHIRREKGGEKGGMRGGEEVRRSTY